jgi:hypothetical protein
MCGECLPAGAVYARATGQDKEQQQQQWQQWQQ